MNENERPSEPGTPESVWKSVSRKDEFSMDFTPDQLCAMARSRERETIRSRRILLIMLIGLAGALTYNVLSISQLWVKLSQTWMLAWTCLLIWKLRYRPRRMNSTESCASFLRREFQRKRGGLLEFRRYLFLLAPPVLISWLASGPAIRLRALGVDPTSRVYQVASGPWPFIIIGLLLALVWVAFGLAAKKATREIDELRSRTQE